jgi:hypothetical protein
MPRSIKASDHRASQKRHERKRDEGHDCESQSLLFGPGFMPIQERKHSDQEDSKNDPPHHSSCKDSLFSWLAVRVSTQAWASAFLMKRQSWNPLPSIAFSIAVREKLCGGALSTPTTPTTVQGPWFGGSLLPSGWPAKARKSFVVSDLKM